PPTMVTGLPRATAVAAGKHHSVALSEKGMVYEWGDSPYQAVQVAMEPAGNESTKPSTRVEKPMRIPGVLPAKAVVASDGVTVILARNGEVYCWDLATLPQRIPGLENIKSISVGASHGIALREDGAVLTWGGNVDGALGHPTAPKSADESICRNFNVQVVMDDAVAIGAGVSSSFAVQPNGAIWGWGMNTFHKITTPRSFDTPRRIATVSAAAELVGGFQNFVARTTDGKVFAWGDNQSFIATPAGKSQEGANPIDMGFDNVAQLSAYDHIVALTHDGYLCSWGDNANGQALWNSKLKTIANPTPIVLADGTTPFNLHTDKQAHQQEPVHICGVDK
ncbi:MAG TPA: hypothetical protein VNW52_05605, partial [Burkholderiaceae bacterium]|nr:hypothetical protein [Burkholderiaceae bacterium]